MLKTRVNRTICTFVSLMLLVTAVLSMVVNAHMRSQARRSISKRTFRDEPVKLSKILIYGQEIMTPDNFPAYDDWLNGLAVEVVNVSGKTITYLQLDLTVEGLAPNPVGLLLRYGSLLENDPNAAKLEPGQSVRLTVSEKEYAGLQHLAGANISGITVVTLYINFALFSDGTGWHTGNKVRPVKPGEWQVDKFTSTGSSVYSDENGLYFRPNWAPIESVPKIFPNWCLRSIGIRSSSSSQDRSPVSQVRALAKVADHNPTALGLCPYTCTGTRLINCCGDIAPDGSSFYDPAYGKEQVKTIIRLCGFPDYTHCVYHICALCSPRTE